MLVRGDRVLLVRHSYRASWYHPGGGIKRYETPEQAARREAFEEVGASLGPLELFGVYSNFRQGWRDHIVLFLCRDFSISGRSDSEIEQIAWFRLDDLPPDISPGSRRRLEELERGKQPRFGYW